MQNDCVQFYDTEYHRTEDLPMNARTTKQDFRAIGRVYPTWNAPLAALPISFTYGGKEYRGMPEYSRVSHELTDANIMRATYTAVLEAGLEVQLTYTEYRDFPVREWVASFTNTGTADTPILENVKIGGALDGKLTDFVWSNGDTCRDDGYEWFTETFGDKDSLAIGPVDGTSCNGAAPYMQIHMEDYALRIGIGWSAMWEAAVTKCSCGGGCYTVGQKRCHMTIHPGETMRTPRLTVLAYTGDEAHGRNLWRRWYLAHILPRENGQPLKPYLCMHNWNCEGKPEHTAATEENQCGAIDRYLAGGLHPDIWWIDAGWYPCDYNWPLTGTWFPDEKRFPKGLGPIGRKCEETGMRFLLWFEPERVVTGTWLHQNHPEWLLSAYDENGNEQSNHLLDLGNREAWTWLVNHVDALIKESHIHIYRQDFNFSPLPIWVTAETEDRIGAVENLHVQGYLAYWDELILRNPGLWIDSCASGGRRNDLDTMRRAVPLHYTDVGYGNHPIKQKQHRALFEWIPYFRAHNMSWDNPDGTYGGANNPVDEFAFQCAMAPALTSMTSYLADDAAFAVDRKMVPVWRAAAEIMLRGDYYPLTECRKDPADWYAMQFDDSDAGDGFVQVVRNTRVTEDTCHVQMHTEPGKTYTFTDRLTGNSFAKTAEELADGLDVTLDKRSGVVLFYVYA